MKISQIRRGRSVLKVKTLVGAFNQEKALVEAFSVIVKPSHNLRLKLCRPLVPNKTNLPVSLQRGGQPPRDLAGLVEELVLAEAGQEPAWGAQFRSFLKQRSVVVTISQSPQVTS